MTAYTESAADYRRRRALGLVDRSARRINRRSSAERCRHAGSVAEALALHAALHRIGATPDASTQAAAVRDGRTGILGGRCAVAGWSGGPVLACGLAYGHPGRHANG